MYIYICHEDIDIHVHLAATLPRCARTLCTRAVELRCLAAPSAAIFFSHHPTTKKHQISYRCIGPKGPSAGGS